MKRSGFKKKPTVAMKRGTLKKESKQKTSTLKRKLWAVFSPYIRNRDKNICFTCEKFVEKGNYQAGHFIPRSAGGLALYFHEDNVHGQCGYCNLTLQGNIYEYGKRLGEEKVAELYKLKQQITKWTQEDFEEKIEYYKKLI